MPLWNVLVFSDKNKWFVYKGIGEGDVRDEYIESICTLQMSFIQVIQFIYSSVFSLLITSYSVSYLYILNFKIEFTLSLQIFKIGCTTWKVGFE